MLEKAKSKITFTIYGSVFDEEYWGKCKEELNKLPANVNWEYKGNVESENVVNTLRKHHVFLFPTLGENYGHVIQEALSAGVPSIISNTTPWRKLEECKAGYVIDLDNIDGFVKSIESYAEMDYEEWRIYSKAALQYAIETSNDKTTNTGYRRMFDEV